MALSREADKVFQALPDKEHVRVLEGLRVLAENPFVHPNITKLDGRFSGHYRYRQGDYRIVYEVVKDEHKVRVVSLSQRADAYKKR